MKTGANKIEVSSTPSSKSLIILYDSMRWEEKSLYEAAKRKGVEDCHLVDCKDIFIELNRKDAIVHRQDCNTEVCELF